MNPIRYYRSLHPLIRQAIREGLLLAAWVGACLVAIIAFFVIAALLSS